MKISWPFGKIATTVDMQALFLARSVLLAEEGARPIIRVVVLATLLLVLLLFWWSSTVQMSETLLLDGEMRSLVVAPPEGGVVNSATDSELTKSTPIVAILMVQDTLVGLVHPGQQVLISVKAYNYFRFGGVSGVVRDISAEPQEKSGEKAYEVTILLNHQQIGDKKNPIFLKPTMKVSGKIEVHSQSLLSVFLKPVVASRHNEVSQ